MLAAVERGSEHSLVAGVLYPLFGILLSPVIAAAPMSLSSVSVIGNALQLHTTALSYLPTTFDTTSEDAA